MKQKLRKEKLQYMLPKRGIKDISEGEEKKLSQQTINSIVELGEVLRDIHNRLIREGYSIINGEAYPPHNNYAGKRDNKTPMERN